MSNENRGINGLVKEVPNLIKGGWLPTIMLGVVIVGFGFLMWDVILKDRADLQLIKAQLSAISKKQDEYVAACLEDLTRQSDQVTKKAKQP